ncbi:TolB amino-terminal domain-containing protein [Draconibacterium orientale]|uniref:TolB amino-terminal domain-containing protein n=2 Tax=Draconibacterium orientale TaxID=1168034 RepID=A0A1I0HDH3_9BACT|nr:helix-turn-helix domain-containing protein [Draconibacterium orientale]SET81888.1 TolB amino-terminal domain-containing protein [Draconibacterium orientale]
MGEETSHIHADKSIVVLPFVNMSSDPDNEYFSDGITEEIINALTKIDGLKVIARTSSFAFKGKHIDVREIARQLDVSSVLEGSVRKVQSRVRITAQLINAADGTHFWSKNFDREIDDIFALQDEISLLIANQIRENYGHFNIQEQLVNQPTTNMKAYELFLKGHFFQLKWDADSIAEATKYYEAAVQLDPKFARAYYGLVQSYGLLAAWGYMPAEEGFEIAIRNFMIASDLDKSLPEYGQSFVGRTFWMEWDFKATYKQLLETLSQHPRFTDGLEAMAELLLSHGYFKEAEEYIRKAMKVDPLSANHYYTLSHINYYQRHFDTALQLVEKALEINPDFVLAWELRILCLIWLNKEDQFLQAITNTPNPEVKQIYFNVRNKGLKTLPQATLKNWKSTAEDKQQMVPYELFILANTEHQQEAIELLSKYITQKRGQIINFRQDPSLEPLHKFDAFWKLHISNFVLEDEIKHLPANEKNTESEFTAQDEQLKKLVNFIESEQPFLNAQLSLRTLAEMLDLHPNKLSFLINEKTGMNFNEFINQFRLVHFKQLAADPKNAHLTILGLAYESGFNSKTVFNAYFKKAEGTTPGSWLKNSKV